VRRNRQMPRPTRRRLPWRPLLAWLAVAYALTGFYSVEPDERAVVRRCGRVLPQVRMPGLHFGLPYGIDRVAKVKIEEQRQVAVGISRSGRDCNAAEGGSAAPMAGALETRGGEWLAGDENLIVLSADVLYEVEDVHQYLFGSADVPALVEAAAAAALSSVIASADVGDILTGGRDAIQMKVQRAAQETLRRWEAGVLIRSVLLGDRTGPPLEAADAFKDVAAAREDRQRAIIEAAEYAKRIVQQAEAEADRLLEASEGFAQRTTLLATSGAERFRLLQAALAGGRELMLKRLILETMEEVLPRLKKIVLDRQASESVDLEIGAPEP
jgi:membrane protease subunit HflK